MASTQVNTTTVADSITHGRNLVVVPSSGRLYCVTNNGTDVVYNYSDDDGATWSSPAVTVWAGNNVRFPTAFYDATNGRLNIVSAGGNSGSQSLLFRAITSNVASGIPGALTADTTIDPATSGFGVSRPYAFISATASNPRYWIIAIKTTAAGIRETRAWYCAAGVTADTGANWSTTNFTNMGNNSDGNANKAGVGEWWTVGGADKVTFVWQDGSTDTALNTCTFNPTVAAPIPAPTVTQVTGSTDDGNSDFTEGAVLSIIAKADYLVASCFERTAGVVDFFKTVNGTAWTQPNAGWVDEVMGRHQFASDGSNFYLLYSLTYGALATATNDLQYRKLVTSTDSWDPPIAFSDNAGNGVAIARDSILSQLSVVYRARTTSPWSHRSDTTAVLVTPDLPSFPLSLQATGGDSEVFLSWSAPTSDGGSAILSYKIYRSTTSGAETLLASPAGAGTTYTDSTAVNGTTYFYEVSAVNAVGEGLTGNEAFATPASAAVERAFKRLYGPTLLSNAASTLYTVPASVQTVIRHIHVSNPSGSAVNFTLSIGASASATRLWDAIPVAANDVLDHYQDHNLAAGEIIQAFAGSASVLNLTIDGYEVGVGVAPPADPAVYPGDAVFPHN